MTKTAIVLEKFREDERSRDTKSAGCWRESGIVSIRLLLGCWSCCWHRVGWSAMLALLYFRLTTWLIKKCLGGVIDSSPHNNRRFIFRWDIKLLERALLRIQEERQRNPISSSGIDSIASYLESFHIWWRILCRAASWLIWTSMPADYYFKSLSSPCSRCPKYYHQQDVEDGDS
jgi:hypothetical protein